MCTHFLGGTARVLCQGCWVAPCRAVASPFVCVDFSRLTFSSIFFPPPHHHPPTRPPSLCRPFDVGPQLDHHCPWTGKCIGVFNLKYFQLFLAGLCRSGLTHSCCPIARACSSPCALPLHLCLFLISSFFPLFLSLVSYVAIAGLVYLLKTSR
jgi:hypothetical protein